MYQPYPQQQGYAPQQPSPPIVGFGAAPMPNQPYGHQTAPPHQFQPQIQNYQQQQTPIQQFQPGHNQQTPPQPTYPDRESYQTTLPPGVSPGWNDPPSMLPSAGTAPNRLSNMRRRPVDPSITGTVGYGAASLTTNPYGSNYGAPNQGSPQYQQQTQQYQNYQQSAQFERHQNPEQYGQQYLGAPTQPQQQYRM